ncbi:MAG: hypothetical protein ABSB97_02780 [Thermoplasmata archaeon]
MYEPKEVAERGDRVDIGNENGASRSKDTTRIRECPSRVAEVGERQQGDDPVETFGPERQCLRERLDEPKLRT